MSEQLPSEEQFRVAGLDTGSIRVESTPQLLHIYESVHDDEPETHIALEIDEAQMLRAFLNAVLP